MSGAGPFAAVPAGAAAVFGSGKEEFVAVVADFVAEALEAPLVGFPFFLDSFSARNCLRLTSKSGSLRYSSNELVKLVGACFILGISSRVA